MFSNAFDALKKINNKSGVFHENKTMINTPIVMSYYKKWQEILRKECCNLHSYEIRYVTHNPGFFSMDCLSHRKPIYVSAYLSI